MSVPASDSRIFNNSTDNHFQAPYSEIEYYEPEEAMNDKKYPSVDLDIAKTLMQEGQDQWIERISN
jgi:hypothetical protein